MRARKRTVPSRRETPPARGFWGEAMAIILMAVAILLVLSLASYHADDPVPWPLGQWTDEPVHNLVGIAGALCAEMLLQLLGYAAWAVPPLLLLLGWEVFWRRSGRAFSRIAGCALLVPAAAACLHLVFDEGAGPLAREAGGWFGYAFAHVLSRVLNRWGALVAALAIAVTSLLIVTRASIVEALRAISSRAGALMRNAWLAWVRHREVRRKEALRLEVARRQRERRAAVAAAATPDDEPPVEPHAAAPIPVAATDLAMSSPADGRAAAAAAARRSAARAAAASKGKTEMPAAGQPQFDFGETPPRYTPPPLSLLNPPTHDVQVDEKELVETARILTEKCREFDVTGQVIAIQPGPVVTVFEFKPDPGVKYSKIVTLSDDLCLAIEAESIRIDRIAGKSTVGMEVPNKKRETISLRELLAADRFQKSKAPLTLALGKEINGEPYYADLARMPHLLVAGSTGSGKSVSVNTFLTSILYKSSPEEVKFIMIDPKRLELGVYENIPHLLTPLVTDTKKASNALRWAVLEMERRYKQLAEAGVRGIDQYNLVVRRELQERAAAAGVAAPAADGTAPAAAAAHEEESVPPASARVPTVAGEAPRPLPYVVIVIDELADLMMTTGIEVEEAITRLAQMARAVGIHLILSTQRPSVDIITGVIKANFPCRIAMRVSSKVDSRTILDSNGAEQLLGQGDMLFIPPGSARLIRLHGPLVTEVEATRIVTFLKKQAKPQYDESVTRDEPQGAAGGAAAREEEVDPAYDQAVRLAIQMGQISVSHIQRRLKLGYARAARLVDMMEQNGIVGPADGSKPREVLVEPEFLERMNQMREERT